MKFALALTCLILTLETVYVHGTETCEHRILLLPQTHASVLGGLKVEQNWLERTAYSQYQIARYLASHRDQPVFSEQISEDATLQTVGQDFRDIVPPLVTRQFPDGLPAAYEKLSPDQKSLISKLGGDTYSLVIGATKILHRVVESDAIEDDIIGRISDWVRQNPGASEYSPEIHNLIFKKRETLALNQVQSFFKANPKQHDVILIFGFEHEGSFHLHAGEFKPECIVTPPEFKNLDPPISSSNLESNRPGIGDGQTSH